jgi:hypothetical protein
MSDFNELAANRLFEKVHLIGSSSNCVMKAVCERQGSVALTGAG